MLTKICDKAFIFMNLTWVFASKNSKTLIFIRLIVAVRRVIEVKLIEAQATFVVCWRSPVAPFVLIFFCIFFIPLRSSFPSHHRSSYANHNKVISIPHRRSSLLVVPRKKRDTCGEVFIHSFVPRCLFNKNEYFTFRPRFSKKNTQQHSTHRKKMEWNNFLPWFNDFLCCVFFELYQKNIFILRTRVGKAKRWKSLTRMFYSTGFNDNEVKRFSWRHFSQFSIVEWGDG